MSQFNKAKERISKQPKDYTYSEARRLLCGLGYVEYSKGKTSGSRVKFFRASDGDIIMLHKPHPGDTMSPGATKDLVVHLRNKGDLK